MPKLDNANIISQSFQLWQRHWLLLFLVSFLMQALFLFALKIIALVWADFLPDISSSQSGIYSSGAVRAAMIITALSITIDSITQALICVPLISILYNKPYNPNAWKISIQKRLGTSVAVSLLMGLGITFGIAFIVPGLFFMTLWAVAIPICMVEDQDCFASLQRSSHLVDGHKWNIFSLLIGLMIAAAAIELLSQKITQLINTTPLAGSLLLPILPSALFSSFSYALTCVLYVRLRTLKDGTTGIVQIFD